MIPVLFKGNETNFNHNGIGLLKDTLSCEVTEVRNGTFDLELVYPITGPYFKDLKNGNIIQAKPNDTDPPHNFRIQEIDKTLSDKEVVVYAVSRTNDLGGNMVKSLYLADVTPQVIFNEMKKVLHYPTEFNFVSNITTIGSVDWELNNPLNLIVGEEGSLVDIFGGEVKRTNDAIFLYGRRGKDNVTTIRAGKNLDGFKMTESFQGKYTQILPYFKYEEEVQGEVPVEGESYTETERREVTIFGSIVSSPYHGRYPVNAIRPIDFSQNEYVREAKTLEALNAEASRYFNNLYSEIDKPSVSINVNMVQLVDSEQYELYERLEKTELTDTVSVYVPEYDVDVLVKITELKYDSLRERTISIVAGSSGRTSLMDEISGSYKQFTTNLVNDKIQSATAGIVNQVLTTKTGVNMYAGRATPPDGAKPGDIWFKDVGGGDLELYEFDGVNWVRKMYKGFGDDVRRMVDEKIAESNANFTEALSEHDGVVNQAMSMAGLAHEAASNAYMIAYVANNDAQQARTEAASAKESALSAITKADDLANKATNLQTQATNLQTQANDISSRLSALSAETGITFQNQSQQLTDLQGNITGIEERISKRRIGSRNLLLGTRENTGMQSGHWSTDNEEYMGVKVIYRDNALSGITNPVKVYAGVEYIFSYYYKLSADATGRLSIYFSKVGIDNERTEATFEYLERPSLDITEKEKWLYQNTIIKVTSDGWLWPRVEKNSSNGRLYLGPRQFEEGNVPTQWHPNEEDVTEEEMIYRRGIEGTLSQYSSTIQTIDGTVTNHTSQLTQQANQIASKVSQTEFETEKTKISNLQTSVTQQAGQIALKANQTDLNNLTGRMTTAESSITQVPNKIALAVEEVTAKIPTSAGNKNYLGVSKVVNKSSNNFAYNESTGIWSMTVPANTDMHGKGVYFDTRGNTVMLNGGETLFVGLTVMVNKATQFTFDINNRLHVNHTGGNDHDDRPKSVIFPTNRMLQPNVWTRVYLMYTAKPTTPIWDDNTNFGLLNSTEDIHLQIKEVTMAKSNIPVDYQKADMDIDQTMSNLKTSIDQTSREIALKANSTELNAVSNRLTTAEGTIRTQAGLIELKAAKTELTPIQNSLDTKVDINQVNSAITVGTQGIRQEVSAVKGVLESTKSRVDITERAITSLVTGAKNLPDGRTSVFATKIESLEGAINQRVTTQELNNKGYQTASDVTNTINNRTDLARKTDIPTSIGGRNILRNSSFSNAVNSSERFTVDGVTYVNKTIPRWQNLYNGGISNPTTSYHAIYNDTFSSKGPVIEFNESNGVRNWKALHTVLQSSDLNVGNYTFSADIYATGSGTKISFGFFYYNKNGTQNFHSGQTTINITTINSWYRVSGSIKLNNDVDFNRHIVFYIYSYGFTTNSILYLMKPQLEEGVIATSYGESQADIDDRTNATLTDRLAGYVTNQTYTTYTADRQQTDRQITEQINQTVSKVPTGPVNLIVNGFDPQVLDPWRKWHNDWTLELTTHRLFYNGTKKLLRFKTSTQTTKGIFESNVYNLKRNTKYTIRVGIFANTNCKELRFCFGRGTSATTINDWSQAHPFFIGSPSRLEYKTITVDSGNFDYGKLTFDHNGTKTVGQWADMYIAEISIIEGEFNNSWTPSFDELITEQKFNETKSTVDAFSRAIGTRDQNGIIPAIARQIMTQDAVISEVAKYGEHNNNLIIDATNHSQTTAIGGSALTRYPQFDRIDFSRSGATENVLAGFECKLNTTRILSGEKYTVSFKYYLHSAPDSAIIVELKDGATFLGNSGTVATPTTATGRWHTFTHTFTITNNSIPNSNNIRFKIWVGKNGSVAVEKIMLVRGEKIGPFSTSQVDTAITRVEQTANSYAVKFLNSANDITTQLNMTDGRTRIASKLIHLDGQVTVSGKAWMDGAVIKDLSADKITAGTLDAEKVRITNLSVNDVSGITSTFLKSVIGTAFIDWMKGKVIQGYNNNMTIDLLGGNITLNNGSNAIKRVKGTHTAFVHFNDVSATSDGGVGSLYAAIGVTSSGDGVNSMSSGRFSGLRAFRGASGTSHNATVDQVELYGDIIQFNHGFNGKEAFKIQPTLLDRTYDLNADVLNPIRFFTRLLLHLNNVGWNWQNGAFLDALLKEWNNFGMGRYGTFRDNTIYKP